MEDMMHGFENITDAAEQAELGKRYYSGEDYQQAAYWFTKAAEQGDADAQNFLGTLYSNGQGVERNEKQGNYWFTKAAEQGCRRAQNNLGVNYRDGLQDFEKAAYFFTQAAEHGDADAQYNLAVACLKGQGVEQDTNQAIFWCTKAAEQNHARAKRRLPTFKLKQNPISAARRNRLKNIVLISGWCCFIFAIIDYFIVYTFDYFMTGVEWSAIPAVFATIVLLTAYEAMNENDEI
jgi:TPR repeat protein